MGQAKKRGTFEQRAEQARARDAEKAKLDLEAYKARLAKMEAEGKSTNPRPLRRPNMMAALALVAATTLPRR